MLQEVTSIHEPLVSVLTPVYNGEAFLRECIESVLAQSYSNWEYIIVNNCSKDRTLDIAMEYAARDSRIRIQNNAVFCRLNENYNNAFRQASALSTYCKIVAADDWLFPECLRQMVSLAEEHPSVVIVGAYGYGFDGTGVVWDGLPYPSTVVSGRDVCRSFLLGGPYIFGTPTSLLFRSDIVRSRHAFFNEDNLHADTEACLEFLQDHDFGFVHQVLTYSRVRNESLTSYSMDVNTYLSGRLQDLLKYGPKYLSEAELELRISRRLDRYYKFLGEQVFRNRGGQFWRFHREKLASLGYPLRSWRLAVSAAAWILDVLVSPKRLAGSVRRLIRPDVPRSPV